jgi:hypothetical protein
LKTAIARFLRKTHFAIAIVKNIPTKMIQNALYVIISLHLIGDKMNIYVNDELKAEYDDAVAKLKADNYEDGDDDYDDSVDRRERLKEKVMRWLLIQRYLVIIEELNQGADPYDYKESEYININKALK